MKQRLILLVAILFLWAVLVYMQVYLPMVPSTLIIIGFVILYCVVLAFGQLYRRFVGDESLSDNTIDNYKPFVNIFIPAHNEELVLKDTIDNLVKIDYPNYNILIINDRSKDKTHEVALKLVEEYPDKLKYHSRSDDAFPGKSAVLNDAFEMTDGDVICVFDSDAKVNPDFLTKIIPYLADDNVSAVQARKIMSNRNTSALTRFQNYEYLMDSNVQMGRDSIRAAVELRGNGELFKRQAIKEIGGWNLYTLTDDLDISTKLHINGLNVRFCPDVVVYEEALNDFKAIIKQRNRWAEGSIRRYLDYLQELVSSKKISFKCSLDAMSYFSEFVLPVWLISDIVIQIILILLGGKPEIFTNLIVMAVILLFFICMLFASINKFDNKGFFYALKWSIGTAFFVILLWTLVVTNVVAKIVFKKRDMVWFKPARVGND